MGYMSLRNRARLPSLSGRSTWSRRIVKASATLNTHAARVSAFRKKQDARCKATRVLWERIKAGEAFEAALRQDLCLGDFLSSVSRSCFAEGGGGTAPFNAISFAETSLP